jgi:molybdate transport system permease protein
MSAGARGRVPARVWAAAVPALLVLAVPVVALVARLSPGRVLASLARPEVGDAVALSLTTSAVATVLGVALGTPLAYALARSRARGLGLVDSLVDLPMVLPPAVAGVALLIAFGRRGLVGAYLSEAGVDVAFTRAAVVLAQLFVAAPYYVRAAKGAFARVDRDLEDTAALDGASPGRVFRSVTVPLAFPTLLAGAVMTWARALGEFGATILFAGNLPGRTQTMPLAIYMGFEVDLDVALSLSAALLAVSFGVLAVLKAALARGAAEV